MKSLITSPFEDAVHRRWLKAKAKLHYLELNWIFPGGGLFLPISSTWTGGGLCIMSTLVHSRGGRGQNWVKIGPHNFWMPPNIKPKDHKRSKLLYKMFAKKRSNFAFSESIHTFNIMLYEYPRVWNISQDTLWHLTALKSLLQVESGKNVYKYIHFFSFSQICLFISSTLYNFLI